MKTGLGTDNLPEIWVFSQQFWLSYDLVVAFLRRTVNVKKWHYYAMLNLNLIPQSSRRLSLLSGMFYVFLWKKMSLSPNIQRVCIVALGSEEELDICVQQADAGEPGQRQEHQRTLM
jgi:hypothetical protein